METTKEKSEAEKNWEIKQAEFQRLPICVFCGYRFRGGKPGDIYCGGHRYKCAEDWCKERVSKVGFCGNCAMNNIIWGDLY